MRIEVLKQEILERLWPLDPERRGRVACFCEARGKILAPFRES